VIVCTDSGEPARLVQNGRTGFVVDPDPVEIAAAMALLAGDRKLAMDMGEIAFGSTSPQLWSEVVDRILEAGKPLPRDLTATKPAPLLQKNEIPVLVADNQVLDPPIGGGRVRIHELYRHMARLGFEVCYVGAFDWPGPAYRDQMIASHFREVITPLTQPHFARNRHFERATGGKTTIDVTMPELLKYSPRFQRMTAEHGRDAKAIIVSHPWVYPYVSRRANQKLIYDSHNCEVYAKQQILGDTAAGRKLVAEVGKLEAKLCAEADLIFVCSQDDTDQFKQRYGISPQKFVLVPNGVDVRDVYPANASTRQRARSEFGLDNNNPVLIFIGSGYSPNVEAAEFLVKELASALPHYKIVIAGSVRDSCAASNRVPSPPNVIWTGTLDNRQRLALYHAADIALNPMFSGSGTNLKMLDYFASGLPVISTPIGARGLAIDTENCVVCPARDFVSNVKVLARDTALRARLGRTARELAERNYDWAVIAADAANALLTLLETESVHAA
jgi:glycosyltransferase involved in cell wall biosynthesis